MHQHVLTATWHKAHRRRLPELHLHPCDVLWAQNDAAHLLVRLHRLDDVAPLVFQVDIAAMAEILLLLELLPVADAMLLHA